ncbi:hypothetical protein NM208_g12875 [Fusarium decemcellulare]|uniref:Uncharacterized protein n=1 Tax=Fusarium decemcellulare TaxID=57161 RepID=A0ACC1RNQ7_9HYPO|nr:hypothetical protein NM208_g12875 [Fusarium decemcellulare]
MAPILKSTPTLGVPWQNWWCLVIPCFLSVTRNPYNPHPQASAASSPSLPLSSAFHNLFLPQELRARVAPYFSMGSDTYCALCGALAKELFWPDESEFEDEEFLNPYNTNIISREDCEWLDNVRILSENSGLPSLNRAFLSSRVRGHDFGRYNRIDGEVFPTGDLSIQTYVDGEEAALAFPIHSECYDQLCIALAPEPVDLDILYATFKGLCKTGYASSLNLDYGAVKRCMSQFWGTGGGTEDFVTAPSTDTALLEFYRALIRDSPLADDQNPLVVSRIGPGAEGTSASDPFYKLSPELALQIMDLLDTPSVCRWRASSRPIARITLGNGFQRSRIYHDKPWLYDLFTTESMSNLGVDWGYVNQKLDSVTARSERIARQLEDLQRERRNAPRRRGRSPQTNNYDFGIRDWSNMNIKLTNRRRIWSVISQVLDLYYPRKAAKERESRDQPPVLVDAVLSSIPQLVLPEPRNTSSKKIALFEKFDDLESDTPTILAIWTQRGELADVRVQQPGSDIPGKLLEGQRVEKILVPKNSWLTGLIISTKLDKRGHFQELPRRRIVGLKCLFVNDPVEHHAEDNGDYRVLLAAPDNFVVGFYITTSNLGILLRLALLEQPISKAPSLTNGRLLKQESLSGAPSQEDGDQIGASFGQQIAQYMWKGERPPNSSLVQGPLRNFFGKKKSKDLMPMEALVFGHNDKELSEIDGFSADVLFGGFQIHYTTGRTKTIGPACHAMMRLDIDGKGGERIIQVHVLMDHVFRSMRFVTNRGRQLLLGQCRDEDPTYGGDDVVVTHRLPEQAEDGKQSMVLVGIFGSWVKQDVFPSYVDIFGTFASPQSSKEVPTSETPLKTDVSGFSWVPDSPPLSMAEIGPVFGAKEGIQRPFELSNHVPGDNSIASWLDCSRPLARISATMYHKSKGPPISGLLFEYADGGRASFGPSSIQPLEAKWSQGTRSTFFSGPTGPTPKGLYFSQTTFDVKGAHLRTLNLWLDKDKNLTGIQFVTTKGVESKPWGSCKGAPTSEIEFAEVGKDEGILGLKFFIDSRGNLEPGAMVVVAIQALGNGNEEALSKAIKLTSENGRAEAGVEVETEVEGEAEEGLRIMGEMWPGTTGETRFWTRK